MNPAHPTQAERHALRIRSAQWAASGAAIAALLLAGGKIGLYGLTGSLIVALSAWDSCMDVAISLLNRSIIRFARQNADSEHPYGHGKAESIAALGQGALIAGGAIVILISSVQSLYRAWKGSGEALAAQWPAALFFVGAACLSILITLWLSYFGKRYNSPALMADSEHYRMDVIANLASGVGIAAVILTGKGWLDPLIASLFAVYIAWGGYRLLRTSVDELMDHDLPEDVKKRALDVIAGTSEKVVDVHKFRGRRSGHRYFFDFHVTLPAGMNFADVHSVTERIEDNLLLAFDDADVVVHADPDTLPMSEDLPVAMSRRPTPASP